MISIRERLYGLDVALFNEFTFEDFKFLEDALLKRAGEIRKPDLLLDLSLLKDFTLDMAVEQLRFVRAHEQDFGRIAIVVDDVWIKLGAHISSLLTSQSPKYFDTTEEAQAWIESVK